MRHRLQEATNKNFLEMDVLSITFVVFRNPLGELEVDM